jgi:adenine-specific DNA glycosylase
MLLASGCSDRDSRPRCLICPVRHLTEAVSRAKWTFSLHLEFIASTKSKSAERS